ncbi:MAG: hypothetical protein HDS41_05880 [Bacteroides sp.]|nr:hypothetical protein [Bacteroides sp.]
MQNDNKIHYTCHDGMMYYHGCPVFNENDEWMTYEEFMQPKQADAEGDLPEPVRDVLDEGCELD